MSDLVNVRLKMEMEGIELTILSDGEVACLLDRICERNSQRFLVVDKKNQQQQQQKPIFHFALVFLQIKNNPISTIRLLNN